MQSRRKKNQPSETKGRPFSIGNRNPLRTWIPSTGQKVRASGCAATDGTDNQCLFHTGNTGPSRPSGGSGADRPQSPVRENAKAQGSSSFIGLLGSRIGIYLHLARQDVTLLPGYRTPANDFDPHVSVIVKVQLDFRVGLEFDDACVSQV